MPESKPALPPQLRDVFSPTVVTQLSARILAVYPKFPSEQFTKEILSQLEDLSFGDRIQLIKSNLITNLPTDFPTTAQILLDSLGPEIKEEELLGDGGFYIMPVGAVIAELGLKKEHFNISMKALKEMTKRFTCEFPIRAFLIKYPTQTLALMKEWVKDDNCHVRRLCSEGTRPRLPLGGRLPDFQKDPAPVIEILGFLKNDPTLLVRRSVANNLNDIGKDNPDAVVKVLKIWQKENSKDMDWIINHATRSLVKTGHQGTLELLGFGAKPDISNFDLKVKTPTVNLGGKLEFSLNFISNSTQNLIIDYAIHFQKANGKQKPKVFKGYVKKLKENQVVRIKKSQVLKQLSTRTLYAGSHKIEILINGNALGTADFTLEI